MDNLDTNLVAVQWGLLSMFGVVIGLLITPAERYLQQFLASGDDDDRKRAARWSTSIRITSILVLFSLLGLSFLGARDAKLNYTAILTTATWLLLTPLLAQAGFVILVFSLVRRVPPIRALQLQYPPMYGASPGGHRASTVIRFINETSRNIEIYWLDFAGNKDARGPFTVSGGTQGSTRTYEGHRFLIITKDGQDLGTVDAVSAPGKVVIKPSDLERLSQATVSAAKQNEG